MSANAKRSSDNSEADEQAALDNEDTVERCRAFLAAEAEVSRTAQAAAEAHAAARQADRRHGEAVLRLSTLRCALRRRLGEPLA